MRRIIAGMQTSLDGKITGPEGYADWVADWSDHYDVMSEVDACLLGGGMYPGYEQYWSTIQSAPEQALPMTGKLPAPGEVTYAGFAASTPHYVLSRTLSSAVWPHTKLLRDLDEVQALKRAAGRSIYLVGGAHLVSSLLDAGLIDELRLTVHPLICGSGKALFQSTERRHGLELRSVQRLQGGQVGSIYDLTRA
jgi:dihydrofolate reductase